MVVFSVNIWEFDRVYLLVLGKIDRLVFVFCVVRVFYLRKYYNF